MSMEITNTSEERAVAVGDGQVEELLAVQPSVSPTRAAIRRFLRDKRAVTALAIVLVIIIGSFVFPPIYLHLGPKILGGTTGLDTLTPAQYHNYLVPNLSATDGPMTLFPLGPNSIVHPLGTDPLGHDILAQLMAGVNVSIELALMVEVLDIGLGLLFGTLAGFFGGWIDMVLARFTDIIYAFPGLLLIILMGATLGPRFDAFLPPERFGVLSRLLMLTLAIGILAWPLMMRNVRGETLRLKEQQYIEAARTVGTSNGGIILRHIIPNLMSVVVVISTLNIFNTIVGEAGLSLLGVGLRPPQSSLGLMISSGITALNFNPTELIWPAVTLVIVVVCFAFVGDGVRDAFDPRTKD